MQGYYAAPLFDSANQMYNKHVAGLIREALPSLDLYVPQENEALNDKTGYADSVMIFDGDNKFLDESDILIASLDGLEIDSGVAAEVGRFVANKEADERRIHYTQSFIYGLYTDFRQLGTENEKKIEALKNDPIENQFFYRNLYVVGAIKKHGKIAYSVEELVDMIKKDHS